MTLLPIYCIFKKVKTMLLPIEVLMEIIGEAANPTEEEKKVFDNIEAFREILQMDIKKAEAICSENNLEKSITLGIKELDERLPHSLFSDARMGALFQFERELKKAKQAQEKLSDDISKLITSEVVRNAMVANLLALDDIVARVEIMLTYLRRYPLIKEHPKMPEKPPVPSEE